MPTEDELTSKITPARVRALLIDAYYSKCQYCGLEVSPDSLQVEHIHPRSKGGADSLDNYTIACRSCNMRKRALVLPEPGVSLLKARAAEVASRILRKAEAKKASAAHLSRSTRGVMIDVMGEHYELTMKISPLPDEPVTDICGHRGVPMIMMTTTAGGESEQRVVWQVVIPRADPSRQCGIQPQNE